MVKQSVVGGEPDTMPRLPGIGSVPALLRGGDWFGTVVFAASGAVTAGTVGMDALGCTLVGSVTALGGGTLRDAIVLQQVMTSTHPFAASKHSQFHTHTASFLGRRMGIFGNGRLHCCCHLFSVRIPS